MTGVLASAPAPSPAGLPTVVGAGTVVPVVPEGTVEHAPLDHAATTPCLTRVQEAVTELLPWYSSVRRGGGYPSQICRRVYEDARHILREFAGFGPSASVIFTRNTTDAMNLLAGAVPDDSVVLHFDTDHHAAMLPWRGEVRWLGVPDSPRDAVHRLDNALNSCAGPGPRLVVLTAANNVTGEIWPIERLVTIARKHGARTVLDAAQWAPHRPLTAELWGVDWVAFSGHKIYAPLGAGVLVGRDTWLRDCRPYLVGGGSTHMVTRHHGHHEPVWSDLPDRHEGGSPNLVGVHALAVACRTLGACGWEAIAAHESALVHRLRTGLAAIPWVRELELWESDHPRTGIVSFTVDSMVGRRADPELIVAALAAEYGISVRAGTFCAHPATRRLLDAAGSGAVQAVRVSVGLATTMAHVDRFVAALAELLARGPRWSYARVGGQWSPRPDPRPAPQLAAYAGSDYAG